MQNLSIQKIGPGQIVISGDEALLSKIDGQSLAGVDISEFALSADDLAKLFNLAESTRYTYVNQNGEVIKTHDNIKRYAVLKQAYLNKFSAL